MFVQAVCAVFLHLFIILFITKIFKDQIRKTTFGEVDYLKITQTRHLYLAMSRFTNKKT
jgi:hypothetical protein